MRLQMTLDRKELATFKNLFRNSDVSFIRQLINQSLFEIKGLYTESEKSYENIKRITAFMLGLLKKTILIKKKLLHILAHHR